MYALVVDYESFCSDLGLLPRDHYLLFVPPCGQSFEANERFRLYYCPATWSRRKAKYLGIYAQKTVRGIGHISNIVVPEIDLASGTVAVVGDGAILTQGEKERLLGAADEAKMRGWDLSTGHRFFLCDSFQETDYRKTHGASLFRS